MGGVVLRLNSVHLKVREMILYQNALGSIEMVEIGLRAYPLWRFVVRVVRCNLPPPGVICGKGARVGNPQYCIAN